MKCDKLRISIHETKECNNVNHLWLWFSYERATLKWMWDIADGGRPVEDSIRRNLQMCYMLMHWTHAIFTGARIKLHSWRTNKCWRMNKLIFFDLNDWMSASALHSLQPAMRRNISLNLKRKWRWLVYSTDLAHLINCIMEQPAAACRHFVPSDRLLFIRTKRQSTR